jgi:diguanylate cyclase (GGDEF)-like protein
LPSLANEELLRLLEAEAADTMVWLKRVHCALMFDPRLAPPAVEPEPFESDITQHMHRLKRAMRAQGDALVRGRAAGQPVLPDDYAAFMSAVERYCREARRVEDAVRRAVAEIDPLTGVMNRRRMMRDLKREWTRMVRTGDSSCVALVDLDHFKQINDAFGHLAGDRALRMAAQFFLRRLRPYDLVYRFGGEEFLFCLPDTDLATARKVLDRLRDLLARQPLSLDNGKRIVVTASIGVAEMVPSVTVEETIDSADRAVYAAKSAGRNRVQLAAGGAGLGVVPLRATGGTSRTSA